VALGSFVSGDKQKRVGGLNESDAVFGSHVRQYSSAPIGVLESVTANRTFAAAVGDD
jgi:hypothetical protein